MTPTQKVDVLRAACCVAGIDGQPNAAESAIIARLAAEVGVGKASLHAMIARAASDPNFHQEQFRVLKSDPQQTMTTLIQVAVADGNLSDAETGVLRSLSETLMMQPTDFDQLLATFTKTPD